MKVCGRDGRPLVSAREAAIPFGWATPESFTRWAKQNRIRTKATRWTGGRGRPENLYDLADIADTLTDTGLAA